MRINFFSQAALLVLILFSGCVDPVDPKFEFKEGLVFIEGFVSTVPDSSYVVISESVSEFGVNVIKFVRGASVILENVNSGDIVTLNEIEDVYRSPPDFVAVLGQEWKLRIELENGKKYESASEIILESVPILDLEVEYDSEIAYREIDGGKFVPGHDLKVSFEDPPGDENFYYWTYRTFENLQICERCVQGYFRNGECQTASAEANIKPFYNYICEIDCWRIRFPETIAIFQDEFSDGGLINNLSIGILPLYTKENMVIEVQQHMVTPSAYEYYEVLRDIVDNSSGLNSPPPAGLLGNLYNPNDSNDVVLGMFSAVGTSSATIYVERSFISDNVIEIVGPTNYEEFGEQLPAPISGTAPCSESRFRTSIVPDAWID